MPRLWTVQVQVSVYAQTINSKILNCQFCTSKKGQLSLLLLVPFSYKLMHHLKPFAIVVLNGEITVLQCWFPKWFWMVHVGQLIQNLVWILLSGELMDPLKPFEWIWMVVQLATNTVHMVSPCVYKTNRHFWKWTFWMDSNGLSVGGLKKNTTQQNRKIIFPIHSYMFVEFWKSIVTDKSLSITPLFIKMKTPHTLTFLLKIDTCTCTIVSITPIFT